MSFHYTPLEAEFLMQLPIRQRRATVRYRCPPATLGRVFIANSYKSQAAWVQNLSFQGAGLLVSGVIEPDTRVTIELESNNHELSLELGARIVYAKAQADGNSLVGCSFDRALTQDELDGLL
jgi:hypothetical protein